MAGRVKVGTKKSGGSRRVDEDAPERANERQSYAVLPLVKGLTVLKCIGQSPSALSLKEVAALTDIPKTTAFRYLRTLEETGFLTRDPERDLYSVDTRVYGTLNINSKLDRLRRVCRPEMERLHELTGATVNLGVLEGTDIVYLDILRAEAFVERARLSGRDPVHTTSIGKAILAHLEGEERLAAIPRILRKRTERSVLERNALLDTLDSIREAGFAIDLQENEETSCCIGAPVFNSGGFVVGAISVSFPVEHKDSGQRDIKLLAGHVVRAARNASRHFARLH